MIKTWSRTKIEYKIDFCFMLQFNEILRAKKTESNSSSISNIIFYKICWSPKVDCTVFGSCRDCYTRFDSIAAVRPSTLARATRSWSTLDCARPCHKSARARSQTWPRPASKRYKRAERPDRNCRGGARSTTARPVWSSCRSSSTSSHTILPDSRPHRSAGNCIFAIVDRDFLKLKR